MVITFISNYINHHQIPYCNAMDRLCKERGDTFYFLQTEEMEQERIQMGWDATDIPSYVKKTYTSEEENKACRQLLLDSEVVICGWIEDISYITPRLEAGLFTLRPNERWYKTGQWKCVSPNGQLDKRRQHTKYKNAPVYLLCSGAYVASDARLFGAYKGKAYRWGYFPEMLHYDIDELMAGKGYVPEQIGDAATCSKIPYLLWAGRMIDWKHPELALDTARFLRDRGLDFYMEIIGGGPLEDSLKQKCTEYELDSCVHFSGYKTPPEVRKSMEQADILLFTSDRNEGWGVVMNEAMNSGCAVIANHMIGAAPYLIKSGWNGCLYPNRDTSMLMYWAEELVKKPELRDTIGRNAYDTIRFSWNPENAAVQTLRLIAELGGDGRNNTLPVYEEPGIENWDDEFLPGPLTPEVAMSEGKIEQMIFRYE